MYVFQELSSLAKFEVRAKTTPRQYVKSQVRETSSDLGYLSITANLCSILAAREKTTGKKNIYWNCIFGSFATVKILKLYTPQKISPLCVNCLITTQKWKNTFIL